MATPLDTLNFPGDFVMDYCFLVNHKGQSIDISNAVNEISFYENIERPFITGELSLIDASGVIKDNELNLGQEFLVVKMRTPTLPEAIENIVDSSDIAFRIVSVKQDTIGTNYRAVKLAFTSKEFVRDKQVRISKTYTGAYSEMVEDVLNNQNFLQTEKSVIIEPTRSTKKHTVTDQHPIEFINSIKHKCQSQDRNNIGYLFYERLDNQFHFRSYGSLIANAKTSDEEIRTYTYQKAGQRPGLSPVQRLGNILSLKPMLHHNQITNLNEGYYGSRLGAFDLYTKTYAETTYNHFDAYKNTPHLDKSTEGEENAIMPHAKTPDRDGLRLSDYADYVQINTVHTTADEDTLSNPQNIILQQRSQRLNWQQNRIQVETYGMAGVHAGQIIKVLVPSINEEKTMEPTIEPSLSGNYIIEAIQHKIVLVPVKQHRMVFTCIRDSQEITISEGDNNKEEPSNFSKEDIILTPSNQI
jgi:hypothetical protein